MKIINENKETSKTMINIFSNKIENDLEMLEAMVFSIKYHQDRQMNEKFRGIQREITKIKSANDIKLKEIDELNNTVMPLSVLDKRFIQ